MFHKLSSPLHIRRKQQHRNHVVHVTSNLDIHENDVSYDLKNGGSLESGGTPSKNFHHGLDGKKHSNYFFGSLHEMNHEHSRSVSRVVRYFFIRGNNRYKIMILLLLLVLFGSFAILMLTKEGRSITKSNVFLRKDFRNLSIVHNFPSIKSYNLDLSDFLVEEMPKPLSFIDYMREMREQDEEDVEGKSLQDLNLPKAVVTQTEDSSKIPLEREDSHFILRAHPSQELLIRHGPIDQSFAVLTRKGFKDIGYVTNSKSVRVVPNQDTAIVWSPTNNDLSKNILMVGIFDGHGIDGHVTSQYVADEIPYRLGLSRKNGIHLNSSEDEVTQALVSIFEGVNKDINDGILQTDHMSGTTASIILQLGNKLYGANVGDSRSFIVSFSRLTGKAKILYINREDKPDLPDEKIRINNSKSGRSIPPQMPGDSPRVVIYNPDSLDEFGSPTYQALAMSRSVGEGKLFEDAGVIATPIVKVLDLRKILSEEGDVDIFAIAASDGLLGFISPEQVVVELSKMLLQKSVNLLNFCEQLILQASEKWVGNYRDDISIAISRVRIT